MALITSAAYFRLCEKCGRHGRIVLSGGTNRKEMCSVDQAFEDLKECVSENLLIPEEIPELKRQIFESDLPGSEEGAQLFDRCLVEALNSLEIESEEVVQETVN